ncbi:Lacal_2735 family protein [Sediminibacter sp. Hel_I_10]|uniref:Lacal_2735 family protein n=1 Tax=Sediminibacter sp. Hel_I_10 TaxID=1392490 RepID=UPI000564DD8E|nr:Lacal_2735 family protein [Sediminibacter sp. Hel_I_10]
MFGLFKKKSEVEKLQDQYEKLMKEWHALSKTNRSESDKKYAEAQALQDRIAAIQKKQ